MISLESMVFQVLGILKYPPGFDSSNHHMVQGSWSAIKVQNRGHPIEDAHQGYKLTTFYFFGIDVFMPRRSRLDGPGALHHIFGRGIERKAIFQDDRDRGDFLERLGTHPEDSRTPCYAWALLPKHYLC